MATKHYSQVRGSVIRVTRLDGCGNPDPGDSAVVVSKRISTISVDEVSEEGTNIRDRNFGGELIVVDDAYAEIVGFTLDSTFAGVDPELITMMTGHPIVKNAAGDVVGFDALGGIDLDGFGFAIEVWTKIAGTNCDPSGNRPWGYTVFPFIKGGRLGSFSFEDGAVQFQMTGAQTREGNGWGVGPFDVDRGVTGTPSPLFTPIPANAHFRNILVTLDPPAPSVAAFPLASG